VAAARAIVQAEFTYMTNGEPSFSRRVFLISGATGAIGKAITRRLASNPENEVILLGRDEAKTHQVAEEIVGATGNQQLRYEIVDLSRRSEIMALASRWSDPLHVLINNAAVTPPARQETPEGIELQFATNVLGYFWLTRAFQKKLIEGAPSRVINVASYWAGDLDLADLEFRRRRYSNSRAYRQSKQANRMLTVAFAQRLAAQGVTVNACHPGDVNSKLSNNLGFGGHETPDEGADTPVWLATSLPVQETSGNYFENRRQVADRFAADHDVIEALYQACLGYENS
jgi:NAD(P)-dependent dehydrogenase (short-subunit alcohol dehydrogenase family)